MSNRYIKTFKRNFNDKIMYINLIKRNMWIKEKILNFMTLKVHRQCDKVLDNIKLRNLIFCFLQPHAHVKIKTMSLPQYATR